MNKHFCANKKKHSVSITWEKDQEKSMQNQSDFLKQNTALKTDYTTLILAKSRV